MILVCTVGPPGAGKTTWASATGWPIVSPDTLRFGITGPGYRGPIRPKDWEPVLWAMALEGLIHHGTIGSPVVVLDSCATDPQKRTTFREWGQRLHATVLFMVFRTPKDACYSRLLDTRRTADLLYLDDHFTHMDHLSVDLRPAGDVHLPSNPGTPFEGVLRG